MDKFFEWASNNPVAANFIIIPLGGVILSAVLIYVVAFFQGRAISFWPPKVGSKPSSKRPDKTTNGLDNKSETIQGIPHKSPENIEVLNKTGIVKVFDNLTQCREEMISDFMNTSDARWLLQIGRRELGGGVSSMFYSHARQKNQHGTSIRILRASNKTPFLSQARAKYRSRTSYEEMQADLNQLHEIIARLRNLHHVNIEERVHCEPFLWRIFIFDNIAYVSGYLYRSGNDNSAVVYKIKAGQDSIYSIFDKYFEYLWKKYEPDANADSDEHWMTWE